MCLVGVALNHFKDYPLVIVANRDEYHARPTQSLHQWHDAPKIYAGRDQVAGGTWLGVSAEGRVAVLTNLRGHPMPCEDAPSRGDLVSGFLNAEMPAEEWLAQLMPRVADYAGFNLMVSDDGREFHLLSNAGDRSVLGRGVHAISNGRMAATWPKTQGLKNALAQCETASDVGGLLGMLEDTQVAPDAVLPVTGVGIELERMLAPRLIVGAEYGTRSSSILRMSRQGDLELWEFTRAVDGRVVSEQFFEITVG